MRQVPIEVEQSWVGATTQLGSIDPLLADGLGEPDFFWSDPSRGLTAAGFGIADERALDRATIPAAWEDAGALPAVRYEGPKPPGSWFGGVAFDPARHQTTGTWRGFPAARWILPRTLVWSDGRQTYLTAHGVDAGELARSVGGRQLGSTRPAIVQLQEDASGWSTLIQVCLGAISDRRVKKVVAARSIGVELDRAVDVRALLHQLRAGAPRCTTFMMRSRDGEAAFVGATPERLCRITDGVLETEALASSAPPTEHDVLAKGDKERREHRAVIDGLEQAIAPLCSSLHVGAEPKLLELPYVSHLLTQLRGTLRPDVGPGRVLQAIYPTAAVGGTPRDVALALISAHESWRRGWYAGAIGWAGAGAVDLKVGIRSALVRGRHAEVFVGAGIVEGSTAEKEWQETATKAKPMLAALGGANGRG